MTFAFIFKIPGGVVITSTTAATAVTLGTTTAASRICGRFFNFDNALITTVSVCSKYITFEPWTQIVCYVSLPLPCRLYYFFSFFHFFIFLFFQLVRLHSGSFSRPTVMKQMEELIHLWMNCCFRLLELLDSLLIMCSKHANWKMRRYF